MQTDTSKHSLHVYQALANETRLAILELLGKSELNIGELATKLKKSNAIMTRHVAQLETAGLVKTRRLPGKSGLQKLARLAVDHIDIHFPDKIFPEFEQFVTEVKIGHYTDYQAEPTCGLATSEQLIGATDQPRYFLDSQRVNAELIWLGHGFLEYKIPILFPQERTLECLDLSFELSSEFPISNNTWPSDIQYTLNGRSLGTETIVGNFSDVRGVRTPAWWPDTCSQYGLLKHIRINRFDTSIDGVPTAPIAIGDLQLAGQDFFTFRLTAAADSLHPGGLTLFGNQWGNHPQALKVVAYVS